MLTTFPNSSNLKDATSCQHQQIDKLGQQGFYQYQRYVRRITFPLYPHRLDDELTPWIATVAATFVLPKTQGKTTSPSQFFGNVSDPELH